MTLRIHVIGLGRQQPPAVFEELFSTYPIIARDAQAADSWLAADYRTAEAFDHLFDELSPADIVPAIIDRFRSISSEVDDCVYLVPGSGVAGDATVYALDSYFDLQLIPGSFDGIRPQASLQIIDGLDMAIAESEYPFDAGLAVVDPSRPTLITNVRGDRVVPLVLKRLTRYFGPVGPTPDASRSIFLQPADAAGPLRSFAGFERIVSTLRSPQGCPWDREQDVKTLIPMMLEEIDELREAFDTESPAEQADELGDVLLHIMMIAQIARERSDGFTIEDVLQAVTGKMVRRHPHVFGDVEISSIDELYEIWQNVKDSERAGNLVARSRENAEG